MEQKQDMNQKKNKLQTSMSDLQQQSLIEDALIKAGLPQNKLNGMLEELKEKIMCGPTCQKQQKINALKKIYNDKKREVKQSPEELRLAEKNYYEFAKGRAFYNNMLEKRAEENTTNNIKKLEKERLEKTKDLETLLSYYESAYIYYKKLDTVTEDNIDKNTTFKKRYDKNLSITQTNDRRTYYEIKNIKMLDSILFLIKTIFWIVFVSYCLILLVNGGFLPVKKNMINYIVVIVSLIISIVIPLL